MKLLVLLFMTLSSYNIFSMSDIKAHFSINGKTSHHFMFMPNKPTSIEVFFTSTKTGEVLKDFKIMHGKIMHMVVIKDDLSVFKHVHPYFDPVTGRFNLTINMPYSDPDNFHAQNTITEPGMYMIMADVEIKGYGMRMGHIMAHVMGTSYDQELSLDPFDPMTNTITKIHSEHGKNYKFKLSYSMDQGCNGHLIEFQSVLYIEDEFGNYKKVNDIQPWLGEGAHAVWASEGLMNHHGMGMHYAHMHSRLAPEEVQDKTMFYSFHDKNIMKRGTQKAWFQIKHQDKVLTIPVVFNYAPQTEYRNDCQ